LEDALAADPGEACPVLAGDTTADVVILGGGYTGMWTAWFLRERDPGIDIAILEADICGGGPSGRNGGFCNSWWEEADLLVNALGPADALKTCLVSERSIDATETWCVDNGVDAQVTRGGHMGVATSAAQDGAWTELAEEIKRLGAAEGRFVELTTKEVNARCASPLFRAGLLTPRTTILQPARLARGCAKRS
jgi:glycine/D-amino acid oxidase-like deaminating enzyme